jgi:uncharacterized protein YqeY
MPNETDPAMPSPSVPPGSGPRLSVADGSGPTVPQDAAPAALTQVDASGQLRQRLRDALPAALKARDRVAVAALRSALAAIGNAEAIDATPAPPGALAIERSAVGVGAADAARRVLSDSQVEDIVRAEIAEREAAARQYDTAGSAERAARLRAEAATLNAYLPDAG